MMELRFTQRKQLSAYEWDPVKKDWNRPLLDREVLKALSERTSLYNIIRVTIHFLILILSAAAAIYFSREYSFLWAMPFIFIYYFFFGFLVAIAHELQHKMVFSKSLDWLNEAISFIIQVLLWNSPKYARVSHRLHHRYTMVRGDDPETDWPEVFDRKWLRRYIINQILRLLVVGAVIELYRAVVDQITRISGRLNPIMSKHTTEKELKVIRIESLAILMIHVIVAVAAVIFQWWWLLVFITIAWHIGSTMEGMWHITEHICRLYNVKDQRLCTRSIKVSPFIKYFYWGLDDHVDHHYFPVIPSYNLPKLHNILKKDLAVPKNVFGCWKEMFLTAKAKEADPTIEYVPIEI